MKTKKATNQTVVKGGAGSPKDTTSSWPEPRWEEWLQSTRLRLWQAVALSCDLHPPKISRLRKIAPERWRKYQLHLRVALRNLGEGLQPVEVSADKKRCWIKLAEFGAWAAGLGWSLPEQFPRAPTAKSPKWPWGTHNTKLLDYLVLAAKEFWQDYDSQPRKMAPTNEEVWDFLEEAGLESEHARKAIALILRPTTIKSGPRPID